MVLLSLPREGPFAEGTRGCILHHPSLRGRCNEPSAMTVADTAARYAPHMLGILRIVVALLFFEHGTSKLFGWPSAGSMPAAFSLLWVAGVIELIDIRTPESNPFMFWKAASSFPSKASRRA
jgi:hypothetical protein